MRFRRHGSLAGLKRVQPRAFAVFNARNQRPLRAKAASKTDLVTGWIKAAKEVCREW